MRRPITPPVAFDPTGNLVAPHLTAQTRSAALREALDACDKIATEYEKLSRDAASLGQKQFGALAFSIVARVRYDIASLREVTL
jgi:hypothetical protein